MMVIVQAESPVRFASVAVISTHAPPLMRYFMPAAMPVSLPLSVPLAVNTAVGVASFAFAVGAVRVMLVAAVGVPETLICVKSMRATVMPFTAATV